MGRGPMWRERGLEPLVHVLHLSARIALVHGLVESAIRLGEALCVLLLDMDEEARSSSSFRTATCLLAVALRRRAEMSLFSRVVSDGSEDEKSEHEKITQLAIHDYRKSLSLLQIHVISPIMMQRDKISDEDIEACALNHRIVLEEGVAWVASSRDFSQLQASRTQAKLLAHQLGISSSDLADNHYRTGLLLLRLGIYNEAVVEFSSALQCCRQSFEYPKFQPKNVSQSHVSFLPPHLAKLGCYCFLAMSACFHAMSDLQESYAALEDALRWNHRYLSVDDPCIVRASRRMRSFLEAAGSRDEAVSSRSASSNMLSVKSGQSVWHQSIEQVEDIFARIIHEESRNDQIPTSISNSTRQTSEKRSRYPGVEHSQSLPSRLERSPRISNSVSSPRSNQHSKHSSPSSDKSVRKNNGHRVSGKNTRKKKSHSIVPSESSSSSISTHAKSSSRRDLSHLNRLPAPKILNIRNTSLLRLIDHALHELCGTHWSHVVFTPLVAVEVLHQWLEGSEDCPIDLLSPLDALCEFVLHASALEIQRIYRGYRSRHPSSSCENPGLPEKRVGDPSKYVDAEILPIDDLVGRATTDSLRESTSVLWDAHMNFAPQHMLRRIRMYVLENSAAIKIQRMVRGSITRSEYRRFLRVVSSAQASEYTTLANPPSSFRIHTFSQLVFRYLRARAIQRIVRGHQARRKFVELRKRIRGKMVSGSRSHTTPVRSSREMVTRSESSPIHVDSKSLPKDGIVQNPSIVAGTKPDTMLDVRQKNSLSSSTRFPMASHTPPSSPRISLRLFADSSVSQNSPPPPMGSLTKRGNSKPANDLSRSKESNFVRVQPSETQSQKISRFKQLELDIDDLLTPGSPVTVSSMMDDDLIDSDGHRNDSRLSYSHSRPSGRSSTTSLQGSNRSRSESLWKDFAESRESESPLSLTSPEDSTRQLMNSNFAKSSEVTLSDLKTPETFDSSHSSRPSSRLQRTSFRLGGERSSIEALSCSDSPALPSKQISPKDPGGLIFPSIKKNVSPSSDRFSNRSHSDSARIVEPYMSSFHPSSPLRFLDDSMKTTSTEGRAISISSPSSSILGEEKSLQLGDIALRSPRRDISVELSNSVHAMSIQANESPSSRFPVLKEISSPRSALDIVSVSSPRHTRLGGSIYPSPESSTSPTRTEISTQGNSGLSPRKSSSFSPPVLLPSSRDEGGSLKSMQYHMEHIQSDLKRVREDQVLKSASRDSLSPRYPSGVPPLESTREWGYPRLSSSLLEVRDASRSIAGTKSDSGGKSSSSPPSSTPRSPDWRLSPMSVSSEDLHRRNCDNVINLAFQSLYNP